MIEPTPFRNEAAARRFYRRMGGIIAAVHLLRRSIVIAIISSLPENIPFWSMSTHCGTSRRRNRKPSPISFIAPAFSRAPNPRSLQSRSSILGPGARETCAATRRQAGRRDTLRTRDHRRLCQRVALPRRVGRGTRGFCARLRRILSRERRWIHRATETYAAIIDASIQPPALRSGRERELTHPPSIRRDLALSVINAEIRALKGLDIPYFTTRTGADCRYSIPRSHRALKPSAPRYLIPSLAVRLTRQAR